MVAQAGTWRGTKWRLAPALKQLMRQVDSEWPGRDKRSDGSIASAQHYDKNPHSDHDPERYGTGWWVTAVDITHNEKQGVNCHRLFERLRQSQDARIKYVIFNRLIFNSPAFNSAGARKRGPWTAGRYDGYDPHTNHLHISIVQNVLKKNTTPWQIGNPQRSNAPAKPSYMKETELALVAAGASPNSLAYTLRFYRQIAKAAPDLDGSKPEAVADWLLKQLGAE